jgi:hypothetical protein
VLHVITQAPAGHVGAPLPLGGAAQGLHVPQWLMSSGSTHDPLHRISVGPPSPPSLSHAIAQPLG